MGDFLKESGGRLYNVYTDASFDRNVKRSSIAFIVKDEENNIVDQKSKNIRSRAITESERKAIFYAIASAYEYLRKDDNIQVVIHSDCQGTVNEIINIQKKLKDNPKDRISTTGEYKSTLVKLAKIVDRISFQWVPREENEEAHMLAQQSYRQWLKSANIHNIREFMVKDLDYTLTKWNDLLNLDYLGLTEIIKDIKGIIKKIEVGNIKSSSL